MLEAAEKNLGVRSPTPSKSSSSTQETCKAAEKVVSDMLTGDGFYETIVPYDWSGTVHSNIDGLTSVPYNYVYTNVTTNQIGQDFQGFFP